MTGQCPNFIFSRLSPSELRQSYRLRYEVFCRQRRLIPPSVHADGLETDEYDRTSIHIGAFDMRGDLVGVMRLVRSAVLDLPMFRHCHPADVDLPLLFDPMVLCEVSRLAVSAGQARQWIPEFADEVVGAHDGDPVRLFWSHGEPRGGMGSAVIMGLVRCGYEESKREGIGYWIAAMEPSLKRRLKRLNVYWETAGPAFDYYGMVKPYKLSVAAYEARVAANRPQLVGAPLSNLRLPPGMSRGACSRDLRVQPLA